MTIVLHGGTVIDGIGTEPKPGFALVVDDAIISDVGPAHTLRCPPDALSIDISGKLLLPGFVDCHAHLIAYEYDLEKRLTIPTSLTTIRTMSNMRETLEAGVTTVRDAGGLDAGFRLAIEEDLVLGPRLLVSIVMLGQTGGLFDMFLGSGARLDETRQFGRVTRFCSGEESLRQIVRELLLSGADVIKFMSTSSIHAGIESLPMAQFTPRELEVVVEEAHVAGKRTMVHAEGGQGLRNAVSAGVDSVEHGFCLEPDDIDLMLRREVFFVPTLASNYGILDIAKRYPDAGIHRVAVEAAKIAIQNHVAVVREAIEAGVRIVMGSDSFGYFQGRNLLELELLVRAGMSPMQAIIAGTSSAAECLGLSQQIGTIEAGKAADLLVVEGDPLEDITLLQRRDNLELIMKAGRIVKNTLPTAIEPSSALANAVPHSAWPRKD